MMGLYDRDYYRGAPRGFGAAEHSMVTNLIVINVVIFAVDYFSQGRLGNFLSLRSDLFTHPWNAWQLLTAGFVHDYRTIWHVGLNMFGLWLFGREVEGIYGRREFLRLYLSLVIFASLIWVFVENLRPADPLGPPVTRMLGASGAVVGVMVIYGCHFPRQIFYVWGILPVPAWLLIGLYILMDINGLMGDPMEGTNTAYAAHLGGAAGGFLYYRSGWNWGRLVPEQWSIGALGKRRRLRVHRPEPDERDLAARVDEVLAKIHREGEASLTREERRLLEDASRRYQQRRS